MAEGDVARCRLTRQACGRGRWVSAPARRVRRVAVPGAVAGPIEALPAGAGRGPRGHGQHGCDRPVGTLARVAIHAVLLAGWPW